MKIHTAANVLDLDPQHFESSSSHSEYSEHKQRRKKAKASTNQRERAHADAYEMRDVRDRDEPIDYISPSTGVKFCSRSEAICAELLKRYVPHFELQEGLTFQVPIGRDQRGNVLAVDFLVDGVLFEYHPVRFFQSRRRCGDFNDRDEYREYAKVFHALNSDKREFFHEAMRARLTQNYFNRRRSLLDQHPLFRRTELIVATTPEEFYERVIRRFGKNYPKTLERFLNLFDELMRTLPS